MYLIRNYQSLNSLQLLLKILYIFYSNFFMENPNIKNVLQETLGQCYDVMQDMDFDGREMSGFDTVSSRDTPVNVLDRQFSSYLSSETGDDKTSGDASAAGLAVVERQIKRRKISGYCSNQMVQISQIQPFC